MIIKFVAGLCIFNQVELTILTLGVMLPRTSETNCFVMLTEWLCFIYITHDQISEYTLMHNDII